MKLRTVIRPIVEVEYSTFRQRMIAYYAKNDCPVNMKPIVEKDSEKLYNQTKGLEEADKMRFLIKKILLHILAFLKAF